MRTRRTTEGSRSQKKVLVAWAESLLLRLPGAAPDPPGASPRRARARPDCAVVEDMAGAYFFRTDSRPDWKVCRAVLASALPVMMVWLNWFRAWPPSSAARLALSLLPWAAKVLAMGCQSLTILTLLGSLANSGISVMDLKTGRADISFFCHSCLSWPR